MDDRLSEKVFELCVRFLTQVFRQEEEGNSPLIHFCGVLGIDWEKLRFREPGRFTPMLAGLIWVGRLLFLEYALPKRPYTTLNWPVREYYDDFEWRLEDIRWRYMLKGSLTPMGSIISLLAYGKYVAKQLGSPGVVTWDVDGVGIGIKEHH